MRSAPKSTLFRRKDVFDEILSDTAPVVIYGRSGSGKSNTMLFLCLRELEAKYSVVILDHSGEYTKYAESFTVVKPVIPFRRDLVLTLIEPTVYTDSRDISHGSVDVSETRNWRELLDLLRIEDEKRNRGAEVALRRLTPLWSAGVLTDDSSELTVFSGCTVVDFSKFTEF